MTFQSWNGLYGYGIDPAQARRQSIFRGMIDAGGAMLAQGPTPYPQGMGQSIGRGLLGFSQGTQAGMDDYYRQQLFGMKAQELQESAEDRATARATREAQQAALDAWIPTLPQELQEWAKAFPEQAADLYAKQQNTGSVMTPEQETAALGVDQPGIYFNVPGEAPSLIEGTAPPKPSSIVEAYNLAVKQGFKGTIMDYQAQVAAAGRAPEPAATTGFEGTGLENQSWNVVNAALTDPSVAASPQYAAAYQILTRPSTRFDVATGQQITTAGYDLSAFPPPGGTAPPPGPGAPTDAPQLGMTPAGIPQPGGVTVETVAPPRLTMDDAAKVASLNQALTDVDSVIAQILRPEGGLTPDATANMFAGQDFIIAEGIPWTEGRGMRQNTRRAIEVLLRLRTGAAAPESEVTSYMNQYYPKVGDTPDQVRTKLMTLRKLFTDMQMLYGQGRPGLEGANTGGSDLTPEDDALINQYLQ